MGIKKLHTRSFGADPGSVRLFFVVGFSAGHNAQDNPEFESEECLARKQFRREIISKGAGKTPGRLGAISREKNGKKVANDWEEKKSSQSQIRIP